MAIPVSFRWDEEFVRRVDDARGDVPRSRFVRRAVEAQLTPTGPLEQVEGQRAFVPLTEEVLQAVERFEDAYVPDPKAGCYRHPAAGRVKEQGVWWCAEPGCSAKFG